MKDWTQRRDGLSEVQLRLVDELAAFRKIHIEAGHFSHHHYRYQGREDFLLQHGEWFEPVEWNHPYPLGLQKMCFGNALVNGMFHDLKYVEGVVYAPRLPLAIHHAWNTNNKRELIDATWLNTGLVYLGVEFSLERAHVAQWDDDACVLDNPRNRFAIFKDEWRGEDG